MRRERLGHTATLLPSAQVLVAGGATFNGDWLQSAELYDPASGRWTATNRMNRRRNGHRATLLSSGEVLVTGGSALFNDSSAELYINDIGSTPTPTPTATFTSNGNGESDSSTPTATATVTPTP